MEVQVDEETGLMIQHDFVDQQYDIIRFSRIIAEYAKTNTVLCRQIHALNRENFQLRQEVERLKCP